MRFPAILFSALAWPLAAAAQSPDPAPSTPVETLGLAPFEPTREEAVLEAFIDGVVAAHMREHGAPGVAVSVVKDGRLLFAKGYGVADIEADRPASGRDVMFRIGSVSKTFVWTAAMMLAERGLIDLDADVNRYLKDVVIPDAFDAPVTMNHLMAHRAGFEDTFSVFTYRDDADLSFAEALNRDMPERVFPPGARTSYSNWGSALAAKVVEDVSGVAYETFLEREILAPLGMTKTTLKGPSMMTPALREKLSVGYEIKAGAPAPTDYMQIGPYAPAGAMSATAADMAQWMLLHLGRGEHNGARLMAPETHDLMWTRAFDDRPAGADLAHGFFSKPYYGYDVYSHGGGTAAFFTNMALAPELGIGVFVSQNAATNTRLVSELPNLVVARLAAPGRAVAATANGAADAERAKDYAGAYHLNRRSFSRFEKLFSAIGVVSVAAGEDGAIIFASISGSRRYLPVEGVQDVYQDRFGNRIAFSRNQNGEVTHVTNRFGVHSLEKIGFVDNPNLLWAAFVAAGLFSATVWLGAWRRQGRVAAHGRIGRFLNLFNLAAAGAVFVLIALAGVVAAVFSSAGANDLLDYPPAPIIAFRLAGLVVFGFAALAAFTVAPAWTASGWGLWRKLHHVLFAVSLAFLALMLVYWNVIFSPTA